MSPTNAENRYGEMSEDGVYRVMVARPLPHSSSILKGRPPIISSFSTISLVRGVLLV
jgi:hypothetical protein